MNENENESLSNSWVDYVTAGAKASLGIVPFAGSLLAEIAGSIIPRQRLDRLVDFAQKLEVRIGGLESQHVRQQLSDEEFTDLAEEAIRQAARSTSEDRRLYLANLLAQSLSAESITHSESKHLLRILGELSDVEVIWLRYYVDPTIGGDREFRDIHQRVLEPVRAHLNSSIEEIDADALQTSYQEHLVRLGLIVPHISVRNKTPEFDPFTGKFKISYHHISRLGSLLLKQIGFQLED